MDDFPGKRENKEKDPQCVMFKTTVMLFFSFLQIPVVLKVINSDTWQFQQVKEQLLKYVCTLQRPIGNKSVSSETLMYLVSDHSQKDPAVPMSIYHHMHSHTQNFLCGREIGIFKFYKLHSIILSSIYQV